MGQSLPKWVVSGRSAFPPKATEDRAARDVSNVPTPKVRQRHSVTPALRRRQPLTGTSYPFRYSEIGLNLKELATVFLASASRLISSRRMAERIFSSRGKCR